MATMSRSSAARLSARRRAPASAAAARIAFWSSGEILSHVGLPISVAPRRSAHFTSVMFFACWYHWRRTAAVGVVGSAETRPVCSAVEISVDGSGTGLKPAPFQISRASVSFPQAKSFSGFRSSGVRTGVFVKNRTHPASAQLRTTKPFAASNASSFGP